MRVREIMTERPATCTPETSLQDVARMMVECDCGAIPVIDNTDSGRAAGIITDRDIVTRVVAEGKNPLQMRVADAMTRSTVSVRPDGDLEEAAQLMKQHQVRRLIVEEDGRGVVGILAQADIARSHSDERTGDVVEAISEPNGSRSNW